MKKITFWVTLFSFPFYIQSQNPSNKIDSLKQVIDNTNIDSIKAKMYYEVSNTSNNTEESRIYAKKGYEFSKKAKLKNYEFLNLTLLAYNSLIKGHIDSVKFYLKKATNIKAVKTPKMLYELNKIYGYYYDDRGIRDSSNYHHKLAYEASLKLSNNEILIAKQNIASSERVMGNLENSIKLYLECLKLNNDKNPKISISSYNGLANNYALRKDYANAEKYYKKGIELLKQVKNTALEHKLKLNLAQCMILQKKDIEAINFLKNFIKTTKTSVANTGRIYSYLAQAHRHIKKYDEAILYAKKSVDLAKKIGNKKAEYLRLSEIAHIYLFKGDYDSASKELRNIVSYQKKHGSLRNLIENKGLLILSEYYKKGEKEKADEFDDYVYLRDSLYSKERTSIIKELQTQYETQQKENKILKQQNELQQKEISLQEERQKTYLYSFLAIIFLLIGGGTRLN